MNIERNDLYPVCKLFNLDGQKILKVDHFKSKEERDEFLKKDTQGYEKIDTLWVTNLPM